MKDLQHLAGNNFKIYGKYHAEIIDNNDPLNRGRLKVHIQGITELATIYPWAETEAPLIGNKDTSGLSSAPKIGSFVYVEFIGLNPSFPLVTGYVRGGEDSSKLHTGKDLDTTLVKTREDNIIGPELAPLNASTQYPYNNVIETDVGVIELDDTPNNKRISIQTKSGDHFEIRPDGTIQVKAGKDYYRIVKGKLEEYVEGSANKEIKGSQVIKSPMTTFVGDVTVTGDVIIGGISFASDHISDTISGKSHIHTGDSGGNTSSPKP